MAPVCYQNYPSNSHPLTMSLSKVYLDIYMSAIFVDSENGSVCIKNY